MLVRKTPTIHEDLRSIGDRMRLHEPVKPCNEFIVFILLSHCYPEQ